MRLLAIDTSATACAVGIADGERVLARTEELGRGHAERLFGMIRSAMEEAGLGFADLDRIAVTVGPGSFTGIRIGIAAARGLALVSRTPTVGISALAAHARHARDARHAAAGGDDLRPVMAVIDARRGELYGQLFSPDLAPLSEPSAAPADVFAARATAAGAVLAGSGAAMVAEWIGPHEAALIRHRDGAPDIAAILALATAATPGEPPRPLYLRPPDAKLPGGILPGQPPPGRP